jgi:cell division control protein 6
MSPVFCIPDHPIFRDRDVLESDYVPEALNFRDSQLKEIAYCLQPGLAGLRPINAILRGIPGTGKTTSVKRIFAEVEEATRRVLPVYVNCQAERTLFSILARVHSRMYGHSPPALGSPARTVLERVGRGLMERKLVLAVCLDDANYLLADRVLNSVLYTLLRLHETYPGTRSGVLLTVSNMDTDFLHSLDPCVMSVFSPTEISFPPYTREEVRGILQDRARRALYPGVLPEELLDLVVDRAMSCGDLRV